MFRVFGSTLNSWLKDFTILATGFFLVPLIFSSCGSKKSPEPLKVELRLPQGENPEVFWYGVTKKTLSLHSGSENQEFDYQSGTSLRVEIPPNSSIAFKGSGELGRVIISGDSKIPESDSSNGTIQIPITRALLPN